MIKKISTTWLIIAICLQFLTVGALAAESTFTATLAPTSDDIIYNSAKISLDFSQEIDLTTITNESVIVKDANTAQVVPCTKIASLRLPTNLKQALVEIEGLELNHQYAITFTNAIKSTTGSSLVEISKNYTTVDVIDLYSFQENKVTKNIYDFEKYKVGTYASLSDDIYLDTNLGGANSSILEIVQEGTDKHLKLTIPMNHSSNIQMGLKSAKQYRPINSTVISEFDVRSSNDGIEKRMNHFSNSTYWPPNNTAIKNGSFGGLFQMDPQSFYTVRIVNSKDYKGYYRNIFVKNASGVWESVGKKIKAQNIANEIFNFESFSVLKPKDATVDSTLELDNMRLYIKAEPTIISSAIDGCIDVDPQTSCIDVVLSDDINQAQVNNAKLITSNNVETQTTGTYNPQTKTLTLTPTAPLQKLTDYKIDLSAIENDMGLSFKSNIKFQTADSPNVVGTITDISDASTIVYNKGSINVVFDSEILKSTLTNSSVKILNSKNEQLKGGIYPVLSENKKSLEVKFGKLEPECKYTLVLDNTIKSENGLKTLIPISKEFKAVGDLLSVDFENYNVGDNPTEFSYTYGDSDTTKIAVAQEGENKYLKIIDPLKGTVASTGKPAVSHAIFKSYKSGSYLTQNMVFEYKVKVNNTICDRMLGLAYGPGWTGITGAGNIINRDGKNTNYEVGSDKIITSMDPAKVYSIRVAYLKDSNDKYYVNIYEKDDSGNWNMKKENYYSHAEDKRLSSIGIMQFLNNAAGSGTGTTFLDDVCLYTINAPSIVNSTIANNATNVSLTPNELKIAFSDDMNSVDINNVLIKDTNNNVILTTNTYDPQSRTLTLKFKEILLPGTTYNVDISSLKSSYGIACNDKITFSTQAQTLSVSGLCITKEINGTPIENLQGATSIYAKLNVTKNTLNNEKINVTVALYDEKGRINKVVTTTKDVTQGQQTISDVGLTNITSMVGWSAKAFVWAAPISDIKPLCQAKTISN